MTKGQKSDMSLPSRSDSFLRMLELEKQHKMQRIQGHAPATILSPSTSSPSAQPDKPFKARRVSGHPPLSHQTQIMKAVRRSSALPSLSISIPPSPTDGPATESNGLPEELQHKKEERTKTVTFSGPDEDEDGDSSDESSICQSPSWEQYSRKKKEKPKKRDRNQSKKSKEDKSSSVSRKKGNRLSKVPPPHFQGVEPLAATDRSQSTPELDLYSKSNAAHLDTSRTAQAGAMANSKVDSKPKSKGFLSSFRLQHGNVSAVQKIIESQRTSIDGNQPGSSPMLKPPSIRSAVSNSTRSISSLDQLPPTARHSPSSSHGRSQSLLSSTLNKLKGPSYLYYRPTEVADSHQLHRPSSSHEPETTSNWLSDQPARTRMEEHTGSPRHRPATSDEASRQLPEFAFPPKPRRVSTQPIPDTFDRSTRDQARFEESRDFSDGYELPEPTSFRGRRAHMMQPQLPSREPAAERERQPRPERAFQTSRQSVESFGHIENRIPQTRQPSRDFERQNHAGRQINGHVQPQLELRVEPKEDLGLTPSRRDAATLENEQLEQLDQPEIAGLSRDEEEDRASVGTRASTVRPLSRRQNHSSPEMNGKKHVTFPPSPNTIGRAVTSDDDDEEAEEIIMEPPPKSQRPAKRGEIVTAGKPPRSEKSADYFSFVNQSYPPPALELRSPLEGKFPSPRIDEEPEEDDDLDHILRHIPVRQDVNESATVPENTNQMSIPTSRFAILKQAKDSPSHYSDGDITAFERLGLSPQAARVLAGTETPSTSASQSNTDPSRTSSERSSSSTCDDVPPSPFTAPTPDSSHPQSDKELTPLHADAMISIEGNKSTNGDERGLQRSYHASAVEPPPKHSSRSSGRDANAQDDSWSRTALPIDLDNHSNPASTKANDPSQSPPLVATPTSVTFADDVKEGVEEEDPVRGNPHRQPMPPRAQSALDLHSMISLADLKSQTLYPKQGKAGISSISLPSTPPTEPADRAPRKSALRMSRQNSSNGEDHSSLVSPGAAYLQEARKTAPIPPIATARTLRPHYAHKSSSNGVRSTASSDSRSEPLAKMLVECCNCKFFHDMPSRVYECMAKPDSLVEDKMLGVSATITTMVKCPWCGHGMTTQCCSGYAAVVYLKEKLHGK
ncbi:hypothetical protein GGR54DRAFT_631895 [Hypoxylon sp. NC1633]|nr:hypothetical protein GGR54DRAFT_631895 [Hypoxylon sp. NC1633]